MSGTSCPSARQSLCAGARSMPRNPAESVSLEDAAPSVPSDARLPGVSRPVSPQRSRAQLDTESAAPLLGAGDDDNDSSGSSDSVPLRSGWEDEAKSNGTWSRKAVSTRMLAQGACALAALVAVGALMVSDNSAASPVPPAHQHSPSAQGASGDGGGAGYGGGVANGGSAVDAACLPIDGCGSKTICYPATGEKTCAACAHGFYRFSEEGKQAPRCLHNSVTLAQAGFPESAAGTYTLHLAADAVPLDLSVGASVSIPTAVVLTISREPTRSQPVLDVRFEVLGSLHVVGAAGIVHEVDSAGFFTAENTAAETPLFITRVSTTVASGEIDSGSLITPVVSGRSTGATFSFTRVAMPVNVTGDGKSVCSLLADVKPAHLQGDQFSFTGVSLTNITDGIRKNKMVLDGDPAHELTLVLPAGRFADLRTFSIPADKTLTVRGVDTLAVPAAGVPDRPKIEMHAEVTEGGVLRLEHLAAADGMTPQVHLGGALVMDHVSANYTLLETVFSQSGAGTYSFVQTAVFQGGDYAGTVNGDQGAQYSLRLQPGVMLDLSSLEIGFLRSLTVSGAKTGEQSRVLLSTSATDAIKVDLQSLLTLEDMQMPMCGLSVSDQQIGGVKFTNIKLRDTKDDYQYRDAIPGRGSAKPSRTLHSRYKACMHVDDYDSCHGWCNARSDNNDNNVRSFKGEEKTPFDPWWTTSLNKVYSSNGQFDYDYGCLHDGACPGCECGPSVPEENQCWVPDCDMGTTVRDSHGETKYTQTVQMWPGADCGASEHGPVTCADGHTTCSARLSTYSKLYPPPPPPGTPSPDRRILRKSLCEYVGSTGQTNTGQNNRPGKFMQGGCPGAKKTGKFPYCTQVWLASITNATEKAAMMKEVNFHGSPDVITGEVSCPWTGDNAHLCTDHCLYYDWVDGSDSVSSPEPMCRNDGFAYAFWNATGSSGTHDTDIRINPSPTRYSGNSPWPFTGAVEHFVDHAEYGTVSGDLDAGYAVNFAYSDWTFPVMHLTVRSAAKSTIAGLGYTKTQLSITNEVTVPRTAALTLKKLALVFLRLAPSFDNHSVTFLRVDGVLMLEAVAVPSSVFTTSVSNIFQDWHESSKIVFNGARLYRESDFIIPPTVGVRQFPEQWKKVIPSEGSRQFVSATCESDPTTCHSAPQVTLQITLATLSGDARSVAGLRFTLDAGDDADKSGVYSLREDTLTVSPPSFSPIGFGFFAPVHPDTNYLSSLPRGPQTLHAGHGGCQVTDRGRCVSQHFGFVDDATKHIANAHRGTSTVAGCTADSCSLNRADRWDLLDASRGHWDSTDNPDDYNARCTYSDNSAYTGCPAGCDDAHRRYGCTGTATRPLDRWIPDLDPAGNFSHTKQWACNISTWRQCTIPADHLSCAQWDCNATLFGQQQCALLQSTGDGLSPWSDCSRPRNVTGDDRQLNCTKASHNCPGCDDQYLPLDCLPHSPGCHHIGAAVSSSCAKTAVQYESACSAMSPTGGKVMEMQNFEHFTNKSAELYTIHGDESSGGPWVRNNTLGWDDAPAEWRAAKSQTKLVSLFLAAESTCHEACNPGAYVLRCNATGPASCEVKPGTSTSYQPICSAAGDKVACDALSQTCIWGEFTPGDVQYYDTNKKSMQTHKCEHLGDRFCSEQTTNPRHAASGTSLPTYADNTVAHICTPAGDVLYADTGITGVCQRTTGAAAQDRLGVPCMYQYGDKQPAFQAPKGSSWSLWNETLLANSLAISSTGGHVPKRFGPSLTGTPIGNSKKSMRFLLKMRTKMCNSPLVDAIFY